MKLSDYKSELKKIVSQRNSYLVLSVSSMLLSLLLAMIIFVLIFHERIILDTPGAGKDSWVSSGEASSGYLARVTLFLADTVFNVTPDNVDFQHELLLRHTDPTYYDALKSHLLAEADRIKEQHISTAFFPVGDVRVDTKNSEAVITGDLKSYVGDTALPTQRVAYHFVYRFHSYSPSIKLFEEVKHV